MENMRCQLWKVCPEEQHSFALVTQVVCSVYPTVSGYSHEAFKQGSESIAMSYVSNMADLVLTLLLPLASLADFDGSGSPSGSTTSTLPLALAAGQHPHPMRTISKPKLDVRSTHPSPAV